MLIFQVNQKELNKEKLEYKDWLFWNAYISGRVKDDDYILLPAFIDYIQDTNQPIGNGEGFLVVEEQSDENDDSATT